MSVFTQRVEGANLDAVLVTGSITVLNASIPVTGTFWQAVQPVSGTFWQATQPVSIATMPTTPVTGTFWQTTQPVSLASTTITGTVAVTQSTSPWVVSGTVTTSPNVNVHDGSGNTIASTGTSLNVDVTNTVPVTGTFWQATQPVSGSVSVSNFPADADALAQASTTAGQLGALDMGAVTTAAPTYTTGTTNPLSIDTAGNLRVVMSNSANNNKATVATITRVATSTTAVTLLAANVNRKKLIIRTETGADNYIAFGSAASATNYTYDLGLNATLEDTVWTGSVSLVRGSGSGSVQVTELV
jgi:hypothetical protein